MEHQFKKYFEENEKPEAEVIGQDGNIFAILGTAARAIRKYCRENQMSNAQDIVTEMNDRVKLQAEDYFDALNIIQDYVYFV